MNFTLFFRLLGLLLFVLPIYARHRFSLSYEVEFFLLSLACLGVAILISTIIK